jgi:tRNA/tmRNA/rRNA uracil-C5-methylase (TrmA/RlmC/RlmD family)
VPELELLVMPAQSSPLTSLSGADVVVMDPPRKGVEPELMEALQVGHLR